MTSLLVQSCSATKEPVEEPVQAIELYDGYFFRIIKKAQRSNRVQTGLDIIIISAEHGVVETDDKIGYYDRRMDTERASELNDTVVGSIANKVSEAGYDNIWINLGKDYLPAVEGIESAVNVPVNYIQGSGIGMKGKRLKQLVSIDGAVAVSGD
ncbi:peroxide stress protein YaaA [Halobacteria archaeon AArc-curdl1]|uniref:Peroxide stress protein YaaA n=1 Tax=Natronosalvus hydrolyticus TaxID=2979988 RepID=A0AAP2Z7F2_9EURY|nr:peroxide stress protein YaaA [Halobacteria archaeon AArc-curdl1]